MSTLDKDLRLDQEVKNVMAMEEMKKLQVFKERVLDEKPDQWTSEKAAFLFEIEPKSIIVTHQLYQFSRKMIYKNPQFIHIDLGGRQVNAIVALKKLHERIGHFISETCNRG